MRLQTSLPFVLFVALAGCGSSVEPGNPLLGTWRSDEFQQRYPTEDSLATTVDELTFHPDGQCERVLTHRYPPPDGGTPDPYAGCTWIERYPQQAWGVEENERHFLAIGPQQDGEVNSERFGCADPTQNRAPHSFPDPTWPSIGDYAILGSRLSIGWRPLWSPPGRMPFEVEYTRVR
jgi:hypothetical protein